MCAVLISTTYLNLVSGTKCTVVAICSTYMHVHPPGVTVRIPEIDWAPGYLRRHLQRHIQWHLDTKSDLGKLETLNESRPRQIAGHWLAGDSGTLVLRYVPWNSATTAIGRAGCCVKSAYLGTSVPGTPGYIRTDYFVLRTEVRVGLFEHISYVQQSRVCTLLGRIWS